MRRDRSPRRGEIEPIVRVNGIVGIGSGAALRSFSQVHGSKPRLLAVKKRYDILQKLAANILGCRDLVPERGVIFVQKAMVIAIVNDSAGAFFDFADVDQHSGGRIGLTGENKVGHIVTAGAVTRAAFFTEKLAVLFCGKFRRKQPPRSGEFDAFADGEKHKRANATTRNRANRAVGSRPPGFQPGDSALDGQDASRPRQAGAYLPLFFQQREELRPRARVVFEST